MKRIAFIASLIFSLSASGVDTVPVSIEYDPAIGAHVTVADVGPGLLQVQRSTDLSGTNWTTFALVSVPYAWTNTWRFHDYLSLTNPAAFYRAIYTYGAPRSTTAN